MDEARVISVLTVNYRSARDVAELAASLRAHREGMSVELIVANNSPDDRINLASDEDLRVSVHDGGNVGYGAGINRAMRHSRGQILMAVNPDVRVTPGVLRGAASYLDSHADVGIVLPMLLYPDGTIQRSIRRFYTWPVVMYARSPVRALLPPPTFFRHHLCADIGRSRPSDVDWGIGAAMFLRRSDCDGDALFDERFFLYFEDVDLCYRMWQRGKRVVYCPQLVCRHLHRRHSANPFGAAGWHHFQSMMKFVRKYGGLPKRPKLE